MKNKRFNKLQSLIVVFAFFFSLPVFASEPEVSLGIAGETIGKISPLKQGEKAPFDGVLLDAAAVAKIIVEQQEQEAKCLIDINREVSLAQAKLNLDLENLRASRDALEKELKIRVALKDEHITFLENEVGKNAKKANNGKWWLVGGVAAGILLTIGGAFIIREIRSDQPIIVNN